MPATSLMAVRSPKILHTNQRLLGSSIVASICLHLLAILLLQHHSLWLTAANDTRTSSAMQARRKEQMLKEAFLSLSKSDQSRPLSVQQLKKLESLAYSLPAASSRPDEPSPVSTLRNQTANTLIASSRSNTNPSVRMQNEIRLESFHIVMPPHQSKVKTEIAYPEKHPEWPTTLARLMPPNIEALHTPMIVYESHPPESTDIADQSVARRALLTIPSPALPSFPTLDELNTTVYSDFFDTDLVCLSKQGENGYLFAVTIIPREDLHLSKFHQHYSFLIDRANCIQRDRLLATKNAVLKSLNELSPDDTFNIIVFDNKVDKLFSVSHSPDASALAQAKTFLDNVNLGSFFAPADLYNPLLLTLPEQIRDDELFTAILLSDGDNLAKKTALQSILQTWTHQNLGKVSLYAIGMNGDSQLTNLDAAAALNQGRLLIAPAKNGIKRKLLKLMKNIQSPLAKNLSCHAISKSTNKPIELFPCDKEMPHMYLDQPFVIIGSADSMDDFILFVQGRLKDRWINIKKTISFVNAKKAGSSLKEQWARCQAYRCYRRYVKDLNPAHLAEAHEWLQPLDIETAFQ